MYPRYGVANPPTPSIYNQRRLIVLMNREALDCSREILGSLAVVHGHDGPACFGDDFSVRYCCIEGSHEFGSIAAAVTNGI